MALRYAQETPLDELDPVALGIRLDETVSDALTWLEGVSGARANAAPGEEKWNGKEVMGHLIDSAVNNLARIVRLEAAPEVHTQPYAQEDWVRIQHYADREWVEILELWRALNEHIAWTMRHISREHLGHLCIYPDSEVTLGFVMEDYIAHMEYHLNALKVWL